MSLSDRIAKAAKVLFFAGACLGAASCGFRPLYATSPAGGAGVAQTQLAAIAVEAPADRLEQSVRNELVFLLNNGRAPLEPRYQLALNTRKVVAPLAIDRVSGRPSASTFTLTVVATLTDNEQQIVLAETFTSRASLDRTGQRFAAQRAELDASQRAAKDVAQKIRTRLGVVLTTR